MFIQTEGTPNPATMKFIPGTEVMKEGTYSFANKEETKNSPLAEELFDVEGVIGVFYGRDFITITKTEEKEWGNLKPSILTTIMEYFVAGKPLIKTGSGSDLKNGESANSEAEEDGGIVATIRELIDTRVRPAVAEDGGDIIFHGFQDGVVLLEMHGACAGCPSSTITLKEGIENMLKHYVPEVESVEAVDPF